MGTHIPALASHRRTESFKLWTKTGGRKGESEGSRKGGGKKQKKFLIGNLYTLFIF